MNVAIVGTGYVGLVSGVCLASKGHRVICVDLRADVVARLNRGEPHIHELGLPEMLRTVVASQHFTATTLLKDALAEADIVIIAVGTPSQDGRIDLRYIEQAAAQIGEYVRESDRFISVVVKSTVVPATTDTVVREALEKASGKHLGDFGLGMNPEFLREGNAIYDFMNPDRIVLGHEDHETLQRLQQLYAPWTCDKLAVNTRTAEMIKYANNCLLATQISAVNELANVCGAIGGIDPMDMVRGVHADRRWNPLDAQGRRVAPPILTYLIPGCGFGGSCFPKDVQALRSHGEQLGAALPILNGVLAVNAQQPTQVVAGLERHWGTLEGRKVLVLGLAFKPGTDDLRESPARPIVDELTHRGAIVSAHDPVALDHARRAWDGVAIEFVENWREQLTEVEAVIVVTPWPDYQELKNPELRASLVGKVLFDARRAFTAADFPSTTYLSIGFRPRAADPILT